VHDLDKTSLEGSRDVFMNEESHSLDFDDIVLPNPVDHSHGSPVYLQPPLSPKYYLDMPINNPMICNANVDLGYEDSMFDMLGGNIDNFKSLGYFSKHNASPDPYCMYLVDPPRKIHVEYFL